MKKSANSEAGTQRAILDLLAAEKVFALRMNSGAMSGSHKGKRWYVRFGLIGCADLLAFPHIRFGLGDAFAPWPLWVEVKADKGKQSDEQKSFQDLVEGNGHFYIVAYSSDDVLQWMRDKKVAR